MGDIFSFLELPPLEAVTPALFLVIFLALIFDFVNGWNDAANAIATIVGTKVLSPGQAVFIAAFFNMAGALVSIKIAKTIGKGLVNPEMLNLAVIAAAMSAAIIWAAGMTLVGLPISGSHSLIGALFGAAVARAGVEVIMATGLIKVLAAMVLSPLFGFFFAYLLCKTIYLFFPTLSPQKGKKIFSFLQVLSCCWMSFSHGKNDAQKVMGVITMALLTSPAIAASMGGKFMVPLWVKLGCGFMIALGTAIGGWKVIKTLGHKLTSLKPHHGFVAESTAALVLDGMAHFGVPVSTTHTVTGAIVGVGATKGIGNIQWGLGQKILGAWVFTLPSCATLAGFIYWILFHIGLH